MQHDFNQLISRFVADACAGKDNLTPVAYRKKLKYFSQYFDDTRPADVTPDQIRRFIQYLQTRPTKKRGAQLVNEKLSPWTIKTVLATVRHFLKWCYQSGMIPSNPMDGIPIPKPPQPNPKAISKDTVNSLIKIATDTGELWARPRNIALIYLLRDTGGRRLGLANVDIDNLDLESGRIEVIDKGDKCCTLRLSDPTIEAIQAWLLVRASRNPLDHKLFTGKHGRGIAVQTVNSILRNLAERGHINGRYNPHSFRHAFARDTLRNKVDLSTVSQLMHHSSITVTADYYARWSDNELQAAHRNHSPGRDLPPIPVSY